MSREIKFIAYLKYENEMCEVFQIDFDNKTLGLADKEFNVFEEEDFDDVELMQFTGLYDKDGEEIYEGDIVKIIDINKNGVVEYINGAYKIRIESVNDIDLKAYSLSSEWIEIIGNIHENPELLK